LSFYETAWTIATMVSRRSHDEIRVLVDERVPYPVIDYLGRPPREYVLHIPLPEKLVPYDLRENRVVMWRTFKACVAHEAGHAYLTNPLIYEGWRQGKDEGVAGFVANLVEDYRIEAFLSSKWSGLGRDLALANVVAYMRSHPVDSFDSGLKRVTAAVASKAFVDNVKGKISAGERKIVERVCGVLKGVKRASQPGLLVSAAERIYRELARCGSSAEIRSFPVAPHRDGGSSSEYFRDAVIGFGAGAEEITEKLSHAFDETGIRGVFSAEEVSEADYVFYRETVSTEREKRILGHYRKNRFNFAGIDFPKMDYAEYLRTMREIAGPMRRILYALSQVKTDESEIPLQRSGLLDLTEAVQAVASMSSRTDVFSKWERSASNSAWAILVDGSQSMSGAAWELKKTASCLAEVANCLVDPVAWALYAFNDNFLIVKDFDEKYDKRIACRMGGLVPRGPTYIPDALRVVTPRLFTRPQSYKVIIVVTDGQPHGYEGIAEETASALRDVERGGISLMAVGLGTKKVQEFFRNWCYADNLEELARGLTRLYFALAMQTA